MSIEETLEQTTEDLASEAYQVTEATNDDGTIQAEVLHIERDGDECTITAMPLTPDTEPVEFVLEWPSHDSDEFALVRLCEEYVGSFAALNQLEGSVIKLEPEMKGTYSLWEPTDASGRFDDINWGKLFENIGLLTFAGASIGILTLFANIILSPFVGLLFTFSQTMSLFAFFGIIWLITLVLLPED